MNCTSPSIVIQLDDVVLVAIERICVNLLVVVVKSQKMRVKIYLEHVKPNGLCAWPTSGDGLLCCLLQTSLQTRSEELQTREHLQTLVQVDTS